jgi:hypothetical protein
MKRAPGTLAFLPAVVRSPGISVNRFQPLSAFVVTLLIAVAGFLLALDATGAPATAASPPASDVGQAAAIASTGANDSWLYVIDAPGIYLDRAYDELRRGQRADAAASVRKAAAMIDVEATRARGADRARLKRDAGGLLRLAAEIDSGTLADARRLHGAVAPACGDLAIHHDMKAAQAWLQHDRVAAGRSLAAAGRYVDAALVGLDAKVPANVSEALRHVERQGDRIADGVEGATEAAWTQARDALAQALRFMGHKIESDRDVRRDRTTGARIDRVAGHLDIRVAECPAHPSSRTS